MRIFSNEEPCRRCSDCVGCDHHWLFCSFPPCDTDDPEFRQDVQDWWEMEGKFESACPAFWSCKHCPAWTPDDPEEEEPPEYIELNMANYDEEQVAQLNAWAIWAVDHIEFIELIEQEIQSQPERYASLEETANELRAALEKIEKMEGCECDQHHGHKCLMCQVRKIAHDATCPF